MKNKLSITSDDAFCIIDGQVDFVLPTGALYVSGVDGESSHDEIVKKILELSGKSFGFRFTTEDNHPKGSIEFSIYPPHCEDGSVGQRYVSGLQKVYEDADLNIVKGDSSSLIAYSVATSSMFTDLVSTLRKKGVHRVFLTGWAYTHCVGESAIAFAVQGFETYVVRDATRSVSPPYGDTQLMQRKLELYGVKEILTIDLI
jgi:nicotinamidase/pyrazinamidase